jgi:hypothetical protein
MDWRGGYELVIVYIQFSGRICFLRCCEGDFHHFVSAEDFAEDRLSEVSFLVKDFVCDVLLAQISLVFTLLLLLLVFPTQAYIFPLYLLMVVVICFSNTAVSVALSLIWLTQPGNWECHRNVCPLTILLLFCANSTR